MTREKNWLTLQHKKASLSSRASQEKEGRPKTLLLNMEDQVCWNRVMNVKTWTDFSLLSSFCHLCVQGLTGERRYTKSPPKTRSSIFSSKPYNASHYVPSFTSKVCFQRASHRHVVISTSYQAASVSTQEPILGGSVVAKKLQQPEDNRSTSKVGNPRKSLVCSDILIPGQFWWEGGCGRLHLKGGWELLRSQSWTSWPQWCQSYAQGTNIPDLELSMWKFRLAKFTQIFWFHLEVQVKTQVQSMPELKSVSLTVGRKALHSKPAGFNSPSNRSFNRFPNSVLLLHISSFNFSFNSPGTRSFNSPTLGGEGGGTNKGFGSGYVPSQLEQKPKPSFQVW